MKTSHGETRPAEYASVAFLHHPQAAGIPFEWHRHPEFELTLVLNSRGERVVDDYTERYEDGDLVLLGPNLPHSWCSSSAIDPQAPHVTITQWFTDTWADELLRCAPEWAGIRSLLREARSGIRFSRGASDAARPRIQGLIHATAAERLLGLLQLLHELTLDGARRTLIGGDADRLEAAPDPRLKRVLSHLQANVAQRLEIDRLAELACLSPSALHRLFQRRTGMSPVAYAVKLRVARACTLLVESAQPIASIAANVGYGNLANFNRQFKASKGVTPREYRMLNRDKGRAAERPILGPQGWSGRGSGRAQAVAVDAD
jgi:AraC-like DNA-binding protein